MEQQYENNGQQSQITKATNIDLLRQYSKGKLVQLPSFSEGQEFYAVLRRPSLLALVKNNKIPNTLLTQANTLFEKGAGGFEAEDENAMKEMFDIMDIICDASFVEPTWGQIKEAEIELTDEQMLFIFNYSQAGIKAIESFRK